MGERKGRLSSRTVTILGERKRMFIEKFGREPGPGDPLIWDDDADTSVAIGEEKLRSQMLEAMKAAGTSPVLIHVYERMGLIVNERGYKSMSPKERAAYDAVVEEYLALHPEER